jgi:hypothetical protein
MFEIMLLVLLAALAWFWLDSIAKREVAISIGRQLAQRCNLQLLDETVACTQLAFGRDPRGHMQITRHYTFEVSANGADRLPCHLQLLGAQLQNWHIPPYSALPH